MTSLPGMVIVALKCAPCNERLPTIRGIPRFLLSPLRNVLLKNDRRATNNDPQIKTAFSFGYDESSDEAVRKLSFSSLRKRSA